MKKEIRKIRILLASRYIKVYVMSPNPRSAHHKKLLSQYSRLRTEFVRQENWPINGKIDADEYDSDRTTRYFIAEHKTFGVVAGLRLTHVDSLESSLSYTMWADASEKEQFLRQISDNQTAVSALDDAGNRARLVDVTRLITSASIVAYDTPHNRIISSAGLSQAIFCAAAHDYKSDSAWIFTITARFHRYAHRNHLRFHDLAYGRISQNDGEPAFMGYVFLKEMIDGNESIVRGGIPRYVIGNVMRHTGGDGT